MFLQILKWWVRAKLNRIDYHEYLNSKAWKWRRYQALSRAKFRCQVCNSSESVLDVHHRTYEQLGHESQEDLIVLCRICHMIYHSRNRID